MAFGIFLLYLVCCFYAPWLALCTVAIGILFLSISLLCHGGMWLLEQGAKALPSCWLFDGPAGTPAAPRLKKNDDGPAANDYHSVDGWLEAVKAWEAGKPMPFNAHNVHWRDTDDY